MNQIKKEYKKLVLDLKRILHDNCQSLIDENTYPAMKPLVESINLIIQEFMKLKKDRLRFKSLLMRDLDSITSVADSVGEGNFDIQMPELNLLELGNISVAIEDMIDSIRIANKDTQIRISTLLLIGEGINKIALGNVLNQDILDIGIEDEIIDKLVNSYNNMLSQLKRMISMADDIAEVKINSTEFEEQLNNGLDFNDEEIREEKENILKGDLGQAFAKMLFSLRRLTIQAKTIANDDLKNNWLNYHINGELGDAFAIMIKNLRDSKTNTQNIIERNLKSLNQITQEGLSTLNKTNNIIDDLSHDVENMFEILIIINKITASTRMLAINAAIEAAHANEYGKGFSIISDEIRSLADSTMKNSMDIKNSLNTVIKKINNLFTTGKDTSNTFHKFSSEVDNVTETLRKMVE